MSCKSVVVDLLSFSVDQLRCSFVLLFSRVALLFSCSVASLFCFITQNSQDVVPHEVHSMKPRCRLKASPLFMRFWRGVASVSCPRTVVGADRDMGGVYRFPYREKLVPTGFPGVGGRR